ncbi:MAG: dCTP deaminase [Terriglobales bacterium]
MSVLSRTEILGRLGLPIGDERSFVVTPFDRSAVDSDSLDLRLGSHFLFPKVPAEPAVSLKGRSVPSSEFNVHVPNGGKLVLPAHQTVLGATLEFIKLPFDVSGQILTKSGIARRFVIIETAPWVHPNYRGCLTLEIANVSNSALILEPGMRIGQLILMSVENPEKLDALNGTYIGPIHPETPLNRHFH